MFKKARKCKEEKWQATKNQFYKVISRIKDSFTRGKDLINDDLLEMEMWVHEIKQLRRNFDFANKIAKLNGSDDDSELDDFDGEVFNSTGKVNIARLRSWLQKYEIAKPVRQTPSSSDAYNFGSINLRNQNVGLADKVDSKTYKGSDHVQHKNVAKLAQTSSSKQTDNDNDLTVEQVSFARDQQVKAALADTDSAVQVVKSASRGSASNSSSAVSDDFNKIDTDEVDGLFCKDSNSQFHDSQPLIWNEHSQKDATDADIEQQLKITDKEVSLLR